MKTQSSMLGLSYAIKQQILGRINPQPKQLAVLSQKAQVTLHLNNLCTAQGLLCRKLRVKDSGRQDLLNLNGRASLATTTTTTATATIGGALT